MALLSLVLEFKALPAYRVQVIISHLVEEFWSFRLKILSSLLFGKIVSLLWRICYAMCQINIVVNGQNWSNNLAVQPHCHLGIQIFHATKGNPWSLHSPPPKKKILVKGSGLLLCFFKWAKPGLFFVYFRSFLTSHGQI